MNNLHVKTGDNVMVISGKCKGKTYQTTKGECYHKVGITPDEIVEPGEDAIDYDNPDPEKDPQLKKAIEMVTQ